MTLKQLPSSPVSLRQAKPASPVSLRSRAGPGQLMEQELSQLPGRPAAGSSLAVAAAPSPSSQPSAPFGVQVLMRPETANARFLIGTGGSGYSW